MGKRPGRNVNEVVPELEIPYQRQHAFSTGTLEYLLSSSKTSRQDLDEYSSDAYDTIAENWLNANGDYFFGQDSGTKYRWPQQADRLVPPIRDMMMRQWSYRKARASDTNKDWPSSDSEDEYKDDIVRKRPRPMDEADHDQIDVQRPKVPRFTHANDSHGGVTPIPPPPRPVAVSPSLNYQAVVPNRSAAQKAAVSITKMAQQPFVTSQEESKTESTPPAARTPRVVSPLPITLKFANGSRGVDMTSTAAAALVQSMIEQVEDTITYHMQSMEAGVSELEIDFHMQASEKLNKVLFDLERRARKASLAREIKQG